MSKLETLTAGEMMTIEGLNYQITVGFILDHPRYTNYVKLNRLTRPENEEIIMLVNREELAALSHIISGVLYAYSRVGSRLAKVGIK